MSEARQAAQEQLELIKNVGRFEVTTFNVHVVAFGLRPYDFSASQKQLATNKAR